MVQRWDGRVHCAKGLGFLGALGVVLENLVMCRSALLFCSLQERMHDLWIYTKKGLINHKG